jgi:hypothetical protein
VLVALCLLAAEFMLWITHGWLYAVCVITPVYLVVGVGSFIYTRDWEYSDPSAPKVGLALVKLMFIIGWAPFSAISLFSLRHHTGQWRKTPFGGSLTLARFRQINGRFPEWDQA